MVEQHAIDIQLYHDIIYTLNLFRNPHESVLREKRLH